ncbi:MAG: hypothetical protein Q9212_000603, partial [Teloschistes hypoglaucus]
LQSNKSRKTAVIWNRVPLGNEQIQTASSRSFRDKRSSNHHPQIPSVRTTGSEEDKLFRQEVYPTPQRSPSNERFLQKGTGPDETTKSTASEPDFSKRAPSHPRKEPRKFHFTKPASPRNPSVLHSGISKTKKKLTRHLACFVERTDDLKSSRLGGQGALLNVDGSIQLRSDCCRSAVEPSMPRKRPLASPAEREWRTQTWTQPSKSHANIEFESTGVQNQDTALDSVVSTSVDLACQLQQFALEQIHAANEVVDTKKEPRLKVKPKPPRPRPAQKNTGVMKSFCDAAKTTTDVLSDEADPENFVFDMYVRQNEHAPNNASNGLPAVGLEGADPDKVGLLVVEEGDQEIWELYGEQDQSSDDDWNSEEEDENAEDFYGNDYPEDELDTDDEHDRNTYKHWRGDFDEEHLDNDMHWSGDEME